ncbi:MAG: BamA/TamA family outer membrane protein [Candidatus Methylomirabilia bacterium]
MRFASRAWLPATALALALTGAAGAGATEPSWERLEAAGARIGAVRLARADVFDTGRSDENHLVGRTANFIHVTTSEQVVREALLFGPGEPVSAALMRESERRLRALPWIIDASIEPAPPGADPGVVDALVRTHDGWSLSLSLKYNRAGGDDQWRLWVEEQNLFGWGKALLVSRERDLDRLTTEFSYRDPFLFGSPWRFELALQDLSDGSGRRLLLQLPFVRLDSPWSAGVEAAERDLRETLYDNASAVYTFPATLRRGRAFVSRRYRFEDRTAWRVGLEYRASDAVYGGLDVVRPDELPPPSLANRRLRGALLTWALSQDRYRTCRNLKSIASTEDLNFGWEASVAAGWLGPVFGGDREALVGEFAVRGGRAFGDEFILVGSAGGQGRLEGSEVRDAQGTGRLTLYAQGLPYQTIAVDFAAAAGRSLDPESLLYLGGFEGLRGYPNHFRAGESRWLLTAEDRVITPWRLWGIAQVGFVLYGDAGSITTPAGGWTRTYADLGAGLRFGNLKGTTARVVSLSVSVPLVREAGLSRYLLVAGTTQRF